MTRTKSKPPSQRQLKVGEEIRHILAMAIARGDHFDETLQKTQVTVTEVRVSPDLQYAKVYVMPIGGKDMDIIVKALSALAFHFRTEVARKLTTKFVPRLHFLPDLTFEEAARIEKLFKSEKVARDLGATPIKKDDD